MLDITSEFLGRVQPHKTKILSTNTYKTTYTSCLIYLNL
uniref:Uncharacterized protein n=1 Tax=Arundo donax TaxID=35708 RepID=A0A0A8YUT9_ARUDO